jgi:hypothetical protein
MFKVVAHVYSVALHCSVLHDLPVLPNLELVGETGQPLEHWRLEAAFRGFPWLSQQRIFLYCPVLS